MELGEPALRLLEDQHILLGLDDADQLAGLGIGLDIQIAAPDVEACREQRHLLLRALHHDIRAQLRYLLLGLLQFRLRLGELLLLFAQVEFDDHVALFDGRPVPMMFRI